MSDRLLGNDEGYNHGYPSYNVLSFSTDTCFYSCLTTQYLRKRFISKWDKERRHSVSLPCCSQWIHGAIQKSCSSRCLNSPECHIHKIFQAKSLVPLGSY